MRAHILTADRVNELLILGGVGGRRHGQLRRQVDATMTEGNDSGKKV